MKGKKIATCVAASVLVAGLALTSPAAVFAQDAVTTTGTTDVTVVPGPDWGQKTKTVDVNAGGKRSAGGLAATGDAALWLPVALAGAAAASGGLVAFKRQADRQSVTAGEGDDDAR